MNSKHYRHVPIIGFVVWLTTRPQQHRLRIKIHLAARLSAYPTAKRHLGAEVAFLMAVIAC
jgi:hypothetical protein